MSVIHLKPGREKSLLRRHPWIFSGAVGRVEGEPSAGDFVQVRLPGGQLAGHASYSPESQIRARVWSFDPAEAIDEALVRRRMTAAIARRTLRPDEAGRLIYSESDGMPGLIVDRYGGVCVVQFLTAGAERWRDLIVGHLAAESGVETVWERSDADGRDRERLDSKTGLLAGAEPPSLIEIREGDSRFLVDVRRGHKTGFYLDQRNNRAIVHGLSADAEVLNCFSYTGGFGIAAANGGARHVHNVDASEGALAIAREAFERNGVDASRYSVETGDAFQLLRRYRDQGRQYDVVILDPPKFADHKGQVAAASRGYKDVNLLAFRLVRPGGVLLTFSCSGLMPTDLFQKIVADAALDARRDAWFVGRMTQSADHPVLSSFPESEYLKGLICRVGDVRRV